MYILIGKQFQAAALMRSISYHNYITPFVSSHHHLLNNNDSFLQLKTGYIGKFPHTLVIYPTPESKLIHLTQR